MDSYIKISTLNDFIFCPKSIYFHELYQKYDSQIFQGIKQIAGKQAHTTIDTKTYTTSKKILQGLSVFSEKYQLVGKIDLFDQETGTLIERKKKIEKIYDGYLYQLYAQYFCLQEMGYKVKYLKLYSMDDNISYPIDLPNQEDIKKFEELLEKYKSFDPLISFITINPNKCKHCIYHELCDIYINN